MPIELLLATGLFAIAIGIVVRLSGGPSRWRRAVASCVATALVSLLLAAIWTRVYEPLAAALAPPSDRPIEAPREDFVQSRACRACHPSHYASWHDSYHRSMTRVANAETVRAPFEDVTLRYEGREYRLFERNGAPWVDQQLLRAEDPARAQRVQRPLELVTGSHHVQVYWLPTGKFRALELFQFAYRIEERRWAPIDAIFLYPPDVRQLAGPDGRWNVECIRCHATDGRPRVAGRRMDTEVGELGITCEACHGPGGAHVARHRNPIQRLAQHWSSTPDPTITDPRTLPARAEAQLCGQCHSVFGLRPEDLGRWNREGFRYRPGDELEENRRMPLELASQWADGVVRTSGREYTSLRHAPCHAHGDEARGVATCLSCHTMHQEPADPRPRTVWADDQLRADRLDDAACTACHAAFAEPAALAAHSRHQEASSGSRCMNCHMPNTAYGLLKLTRNHAIESPSVATQLATGRPNACNLCHLDRPLAWTAETLREWTGAPAPPLPEDAKQIAESVRWLLSGDANLRAIAAWHLGWRPAREASGLASGDRAALDWSTPFLAQLLVDPYSAVRFIAERSLREQSLLAGFDYDFVGDAPSRAAAHAALLQRWRDRRADPPATHAALLLDARGELDADVFARLLEARDDRRVALEE